jgi:hypothetical protein
VPGRRRDQAEQHADGRGLAGAVRAEEAVHLARRDVEIKLAHRDRGTEALGQVRAADDVHAVTVRAPPAARRPPARPFGVAISVTRAARQGTPIRT